MYDTLLKQASGALSINHFPKRVQEEILAKLTETILKRVTLSVLEKLAPGEQEVYEALAEKREYVKADAYLRRKIPDYNNFIKSEIADEIRIFKEKAGL